jgi:hypothetical protein
MSTLNQRLPQYDHRIVRWYGNDSEEMAAEFCHEYSRPIRIKRQPYPSPPRSASKVRHENKDLR